MKKATLIVWVIILGFIALVIFQNQTFFMSHHALQLNLGVVKHNLPPNVPIAVVFIFFFLSGLVIAYLFGLSTRFKARRTAKKLNAAIISHKDEAAKLKSELDTLKGQDTPATSSRQAAETKTGTDGIIELTGDHLVDNPADQQEANPAKDSKDKMSNKKS
jgi:uncharacterized integral membrane protein